VSDTFDPVRLTTPPIITQLDKVALSAEDVGGVNVHKIPPCDDCRNVHLTNPLFAPNNKDTQTATDELIVFSNAIFENVRLDFPEPDNKAPENNDVPVFAIFVMKTLPVVKPLN
jgi:hypothetical protein